MYTMERASSDYDIRNNFQTALTYDLPGSYDNRFLSATLRNWSVDARVSARSAVPVDILGPQYNDPTTGERIYFHPNRVLDQPLYINDPTAPGGRRINFDAFSSAPAGTEGDLGRNAARGFNAVEADMALRRNIHLTDKAHLQFRAEAFNILNHPIFGSIYNQLSNGASLFGRAYNTQNEQLGGLNSLYQVGGPRSLQMALRLQF